MQTELAKASAIGFVGFMAEQDMSSDQEVKLAIGLSGSNEFDNRVWLG